MTYEVTIGIPLYNAEQFIRRALDSALAQTFKSVEFLVLDDCGTDSSLDIVKEYQQTHPRGKDIRIVSQLYNKGIGMARNRIVEEARGRYLYFMDADDAITPNAIEHLYLAAQKYSADVVYGSYERIEEYCSPVRRIRKQYAETVFLEENAFASWVYDKYDNLQAMIWNILLDVNIYRKNNLSHLPISYLEDLVFTMDLPAYVHRVVMLSDVTYFYYCRENSASKYQNRTYIKKREIESTIGAMRHLKNISFRFKLKPYFPLRMCKVMMTCYFVTTHIMKNEHIIEPPFTNREIRNVMSTPLTWGDMFWPCKYLMKNLFLYLLGQLPPSLSVWLIRKSM